MLSSLNIYQAASHLPLQDYVAEAQFNLAASQTRSVLAEIGRSIAKMTTMEYVTFALESAAAVHLVAATLSLLPAMNDRYCTPRPVNSRTPTSISW